MRFDFFSSLTIPGARSRIKLHRCSDESTGRSVGRPRFGLCALRSRISRYTYATRDLLPMIMRGWKYAYRRRRRMTRRRGGGPSPSAIERLLYRLTWPRRLLLDVFLLSMPKHGALPARWREDIRSYRHFFSAHQSISFLFLSLRLILTNNPRESCGNVYTFYFF